MILFTPLTLFTPLILSAMDSFTRINHVGIRVSGKDYSKARSFYEKLGFEWIVGPVGPEPVAIMEHEKSGITINLILNGNAKEGEPHNVLMDDKAGNKYAGHTHIALEVQDLDAVQASLEAEGIKIEERMPLPGNGASLFIRDPDRTTIEFHQPGAKWWEDSAIKEKMEAAAAAKKTEREHRCEQDQESCDNKGK